MGAKYTDAQKRATAKYKAVHRDKLTLDIAKGYKDKYKAYAQSKGQSLTALIVDLIDKDMTAAGWSLEDDPPTEAENSGED